MTDPRLTLGCVPMLVGVVLILLEQQSPGALFETLGSMSFVGGIIVLVHLDRR